MSGLGADVGVHVLDGDGVALLLAGRDTGVRLAVGDVAESLVAIAARFVEMRGKAWRVNELADIAALLPGVELGTPFPPVTKAAGGLDRPTTTAGSRWAPRCRWACCPRASRSTSPRSRPRW